MTLNRSSTYSFTSWKGKLIQTISSKLPWQNLQNIGDRDRTEVVGEYKVKTELTELCKDLPAEFVTIFK
jgi:hypothetical protein